jgi:hypothetical protein
MPAVPRYEWLKACQTSRGCMVTLEGANSSDAFEHAKIAGSIARLSAITSITGANLQQPREPEHLCPAISSHLVERKRRY